VVRTGAGSGGRGRGAEGGRAHAGGGVTEERALAHVRKSVKQKDEAKVSTCVCKHEECASRKTRPRYPHMPKRYTQTTSSRYVQVPRRSAGVHEKISEREKGQASSKVQGQVHGQRRGIRTQQCHRQMVTLYLNANV
jgi:hypothetical protein